MPKSKMSPVLAGLAAATGSDPYDASRTSLEARARQRMIDDAQQEDADVAEGPAFPGYGLDMGRGDRNRRLLGLTSPMAGAGGTGMDAFFESIREAGERQGKRAGYDLGESGLSDAPDANGTLPMSLQGLQGVQYKYDGTRPVAARFRR